MKEIGSFESEISGLLRSVLDASQLDVSFDIALYPGETPAVSVLFSGPEATRLTARNGELLLALEHVIAEVREFEPEERDLLFVDADGFKERRNGVLLARAREAAARVAATGMPYVFDPMSSHERRLLHLALTPTGLHSASRGEGLHRAVVLYPRSSDQD